MTYFQEEAREAPSAGAGDSGGTGNTGGKNDLKKIQEIILAALPCLCAFLLMGVYALELFPRLNLAAVNLICLFLACLKLLPGIVGAVNRRKAGSFASSLAIALAALAVNLRGQMPQSLSSLSAWEILWAGMAAVSAVCLAAVLLRLLRWSQKNWEQEREAVQSRRRERRENRREWWRNWRQYWAGRLTARHEYARGRAEARREYKKDLENQQMAERLSRTKTQIAYRKYLLYKALGWRPAPKGQFSDKKPAEENKNPQEIAKGFTAKDHLLTGLIILVVLTIIIELPFAVGLKPASSVAPGADGAQHLEENAGEEQKTYFNQWVEAVKELVSDFKDMSSEQLAEDENQPPEAEAGSADADRQQAGLQGQGNPIRQAKNDQKKQNPILEYFGIVGSLIFSVCLGYYILLAFVKRKLRGSGKKNGDSEEEFDFLDAYAVPMALLMVSLLMLYTLGNEKGISDIMGTVEDLLSAIFFILVLLTAFEVVRLVLEQCGRVDSALRRMIRLIFFTVLEFIAQIIIGVFRSLHIENAVSSLLTLVFPGEPDEIPTRVLEKTKQMLRNEIDAVSEEAENGFHASAWTAAGSGAGQERETVRRDRFFRRKIWRKQK